MNVVCCVTTNLKSEQNEGANLSSAAAHKIKLETQVHKPRDYDDLYDDN